MFSPLLTRIIAQNGMSVVDTATLSAFTTDNRFSALLFAGDYERVAESDDVAVILPELVRAFDGAFTAAVVDRNSERELQLRFRINTFPALVFLRDGQYLGAITKVRDWEDYLKEIADILLRDPGTPPPYRLPMGAMAPEPDETRLH